MKTIIKAPLKFIALLQIRSNTDILWNLLALIIFAIAPIQLPLTGKDKEQKEGDSQDEKPAKT